MRTCRFFTYNWKPVVFPVCRFGYNKIDSHTQLVDVAVVGEAWQIAGD